jgi:hypothetical protein
MSLVSSPQSIGKISKNAAKTGKIRAASRNRRWR